MPEEDWPSNYFNYFTEVEDCFQRARGTGLFLLSPLDWALIDTWRSSGVPLEAVLKGVDYAFEKWRSGKRKRRIINSLAYCAQAVMECAKRTRAVSDTADRTAEIFEVQQIVKHLLRSAVALRMRPEATLSDIAQTLECLAQEADKHAQNLEELEQRLSSLEEKVVAVLRSAESDDDLLSLRKALDSELRPYRSKMTADQLAMLERRYLDTELLKRAQLPRLSLFYLH